jgi:hypothetical protein
MKSFRKGGYSNIQEKREVVLDTIKPICNAFGIVDYDYVIDESKGMERLVVEGQAIGCRCNSINAVVDELVNYIWIVFYAQERDIGAFSTQTLNAIKRYWIKKGGK